ncbi:hypothetical protein A3C23_02820 [Candidatus Roizmanbacteria bacterium RIFCSPHIGHO2_02_FULL_37_13b]|uniref:UDP-N-acetylmuramate--L-alanine ligase n=1 Tax=Candidatus Roizmanbacteria bacterium RIFCSPLOWO2_02_FULL_36_11 TaxID=1802071 RepID=A0A1F7JGC0_9BACT|nr:MAG: hypothetical protein A3C23_02820 [Candidatus Roizmanbacteria bacterium RIFCSPHIGHO2_02_FULL_37_13b]OGK54606.1 MAG: hypothetical protein A3H78_01840 [Candidatus Roizmanbacteria bacterium RIFCSPLOWO2_02_FULL_36_11]
MDIQKTQNIYMVGIKGVGMTALALILKKMNKNVWGSDLGDEYKTDEVLKKNNISISLGFKEQNINDDIDLVITTAAHGGLSNIEVQKAMERNIVVMTHAQALGQVMNLFKVKISVCGSHGKTTVSAMIAFVFAKLGKKFGYHVGVSSFSGFDAGGFSGFDYFVSEADEYVASPGIDNTPRFMYQNPDIIICTNIDFDHPDVYKSLDEVNDAFTNFLEKLTTKTCKLIYYKNDVLLQKIAGQLLIPEIHTYDLDDAQNLSLNISGKHNRLNAAAVLALFRSMGEDESQVKKAITEFRGSSRRFEKIYENFGSILYDDYAHHPMEIVATIEAARAQYPTRRLLVIFQPHTYSRTQTFKSGFINALAKADISIVTEIYSSKREAAKNFSISSPQLVEEARNQGFKNISFCPIDDLSIKLKTILKRGDVIVTMGAGSIYQAHSDIIRAMNDVM